MRTLSWSLCLVVLLYALPPSALGAGESCELMCDDSDLCLLSGSVDDPFVCLRKMENKLKAVLGKVDELMQEINATRAEFDAFKTQQAV